MILTRICFSGAKSISDVISSKFDTCVFNALLEIIESIDHIQSAGCLKWLIILVYKVTQQDQTKILTNRCIGLLTKIADELSRRVNPYHLILRSRYGLYGIPLEPELFDIEPPAPIKGSSTVTYASVVAGENTSHNMDFHKNFAFNKEHLDPKEILMSTSNDSKIKLKNITPSKLFRGLLETEHLHFTCVSASDGTRVEKADINLSNLPNGIVPLTVAHVQNSGTKKVDVEHYISDISDNVYIVNNKVYSNGQGSSNSTNSLVENVYQMILHTDNNEDFTKLSKCPISRKFFFAYNCFSMH